MWLQLINLLITTYTCSPCSQANLCFPRKETPMLSMTFLSVSSKEIIGSALQVSAIYTSGTRVVPKREELVLEQSRTVLTVGMKMGMPTPEVRMETSTTGLMEVPQRKFLLTRDSSVPLNSVKVNFSQELLMELKFGLLTDLLA